MRASATRRSAVFASFLLSPLRCSSWRTSFSSIPASSWSYHAPKLPILAAWRIQSRYSRTPAMTMARRSDAAKPRSRPKISTLAVSRFTSHSHGPGRVSSKSVMSNSIRRSGVPNRPKFDRWASPHSCTVTPECGVVARSAAMTNAAPQYKVKGEISIARVGWGPTPEAGSALAPRAGQSDRGGLALVPTGCGLAAAPRCALPDPWQPALPPSDERASTTIRTA